MNNIDKTIPYNPSIADLENLRILRKKMNLSSSIEDGEEKELLAIELMLRYSNPESKNKVVEKKLP